MNMPAEPNPFPTLKAGLALGAKDHRGFVNAWNWLCGIMRAAKDYFCLGVNGRTGNVNIIAGEGINVTAEGKTIMISTGDGTNTDNGDGTGGGGGGGGAGGGASDGDDNDGDWTDAQRPTEPSDPSTQCNDWTEDDVGNGWGSGEDNQGDNCRELNGW